MSEQKLFSLGELASTLELELVGNREQVISGIATLANASANQLSFYSNKNYYSDLQRTKAGVVIVHRDDLGSCPGNALISEQPYASYAQASQLFFSPAVAAIGIHPTAIVDSSAKLGKNITLLPYVIVGSETSLADNVVVHANTVIGNNCTIGRDSVLHSNVSLYNDVKIGDRAIIHSGVVLGSDGFGYAPHNGKQYKIAQLGGVTIGADVEIGAGSSIDRGALDDTIVGNGVKIDNQVQIAHNVSIGDNTVICGCSAIAGSSTIGKNCIIAGGVGIINHISLADGVTITAMSLVNQSIKNAGVYSSGTGLSETGKWKKNIVRFRQLEEMWQRLTRLEKKQD